MIILGSGVTGLKPGVNEKRRFQSFEAGRFGNLRLEYEAGMAILVALLPNCDDLIDRNIAVVVAFVPELQDARFNLNYLTAKARGSSADNVNFAIDHFG